MSARAICLCSTFSRTEFRNDFAPARDAALNFLFRVLRRRSGSRSCFPTSSTRGCTHIASRTGETSIHQHRPSPENRDQAHTNVRTRLVVIVELSQFRTTSGELHEGYAEASLSPITFVGCTRAAYWVFYLSQQLSKRSCEPPLPQTGSHQNRGRARSIKVDARALCPGSSSSRIGYLSRRTLTWLCTER